MDSDKIRGSTDPSEHQTEANASSTPKPPNEAENNHNNNTVNESNLDANSLNKINLTNSSVRSKKIENNSTGDTSKTKTTANNSNTSKSNVKKERLNLRKSFKEMSDSFRNNKLTAQYSLRTPTAKTQKNDSKNNTLMVKPQVSVGNFLSPSANGNLSAGATVDSEIAPARKKVILGKGYSLMDWVRLTKETPDLAGNKGILRKITYEEMALHNKEDDCWFAVQDKVYNITPYMKFHPGGVDELMRGAGMNATDLFNEVHPWVNIQSMLEKCLVGNLVGGPPPPPSDIDKKIDKSISKDSLKSNDKKEEKSVSSLNSDTSSIKSENSSKEIPVLDSYQSIDTVNIVLYTKCKNLKDECLIIDKSDQVNKNAVCLYLYIPYGVYKYVLDMPAPTTDNYDVKVSKEGKVELTLHKIERIHWWQMCPKLNFQAEAVLNSNSGVNFRACDLADRIKVSHDTDLYYFNLPSSSRMIVPVGYHVYLRPLNEEYLVKPYTVVNESITSSSQPQLLGKQLCLMIKHYDDGALTSKLKNLKIGSQIEVSNYAGSFKMDKLDNCKELVMICAGSGFTPMIRLIYHALKIDQIKGISLLFFNKTSRDILWNDQLDDIEAKHPKKFKFTNILSKPEPDWKGHTGRVNKTLLENLIGKNMNKPLICVCGPKEFSELTIQLLHKMDYTDEIIHPFLS